MGQTLPNCNPFPAHHPRNVRKVWQYEDDQALEKLSLAEPLAKYCTRFAKVIWAVGIFNVESSFLNLTLHSPNSHWQMDGACIPVPWSDFCWLWYVLYIRGLRLWHDQLWLSPNLAEHFHSPFCTSGLVGAPQSNRKRLATKLKVLG